LLLIGPVNEAGDRFRARDRRRLTTETDEQGNLGQPVARRKAEGRIGLIVAASLAAGLVLAIVAVAVPLFPATTHVLTGLVLLAFALGWASLAVLSVRLSDQPQRWAMGPAIFMSVLGLAVLSGSAAVHSVMRWVWPPALLALVVWMVWKARRQLRSRSRRWLLYPLLAVLVVASIGGGFQTVSETLDARAYPPPGQLVDVGGRKLHLHCTGSGSPTVILEPGHGGSSSDLGWIAPAIARDSRVCVYDRAGRGWSDAAEGPQDASHIAADLNTLLDRGRVPGPYVLAGHSFGGLYTLTFAARYPDRVAGMVLLDSTAPRPGPAPPTTGESFGVLDRFLALAPAVAHLGVTRLIAQVDGGLPPRSEAEARANASTARHLDSYIEEFLRGAASTQQAAALADLNDKPLIVVTADTGNDQAWHSAQEHLTTLSTNSLHRVAKATTHGSLVADEADAGAATQAIRDVVASVRTSQPLASR
jgi:pimeloyl-ACP methyl ester carboxylesterase